MKHIRKRVFIIGLIILLCGTLNSCGTGQNQNGTPVIKKQDTVTQEMDERWEEASATPLGKYPELVTYTLGKMTMDHNSNMPEGDTYENNGYTRYLKKVLNVQNIDVLEGKGTDLYEQMEWMAIQEGEIPDVMLVTYRNILTLLVEQDMIEDLTDVYETCTSDRIKEMYGSYGVDILKSAEYDGKLMAFPETQVYSGPGMIWLRKDWIDKLDLKEPTTLDEALDIVAKFQEQNPGNHPEGNIGLALDPLLVEKADQCFSVSPIFDAYHAYPQKWIPDENGQMVYGSVQPEMKEALKKLRQLYEDGVLDPNFMIRNEKNFPELLENGQCGAFFGWWWAPNDPLYSIYDKTANWQPYVFATDNHCETSLSYGRNYYIVVKKGYEHPEIVPKILSALYDYARYDGKDDAKEVGDYLGLNVHNTATPLVINLDYSDAIFRTTKHIREYEDRKIGYDEMTVLEQGFSTSFRRYFTASAPTASMWAAYTSRMKAVAKLAELDITYVNEGYTQQYDQLFTDSLRIMEEKAFIMIITGEKPLDYFDSFVEQWYQNGGNDLVKAAN